MKKILLLIASFLIFSCSNESVKNNINSETSSQSFRKSSSNYQIIQENKVLLLKVDYNTNNFEGGKEFTFANNSATFTITNQVVPPADFGSIKLTYSEINQQLFFGTIHWMGLGQITFPTNFLPANSFNVVNTFAPIPFPSSGFQNIYNPNNQIFDYNPIWNSIAYREKVIQYRASNPNATIKIFLYTPGVGIGDPAHWKWIIFLKN